MSLDQYVKKLIEENGDGLLVAWYLILSYAYYHMDTSLVTDEYYDSLCNDLLTAKENDTINHRHLHLCDMEALKAGTAFHLKKSDYPGMAVGSAEELVKEHT
jgi:hypothetical protein